MPSTPRTAAIIDALLEGNRRFIADGWDATEKRL